MPRRKPDRYEQLHGRVYRALDNASQRVHGGDWCVFGLGDPGSPLCGWCPSCHHGTVAVWLVDTQPPQVDTAGCDAGCNPQQVIQALQ